MLWQVIVKMMGKEVHASGKDQGERGRVWATRKTGLAEMRVMVSVVKGCGMSNVCAKAAHARVLKR